MKTPFDLKPSLFIPVFVAASLGCFLSVAPAQAQRDMSTIKRSATSTNAAVTSKLTGEEQQFVTEAGGGNAAEVYLAELALKNGQSNDVKSLAQTMIKDHSQANRTLGEVASNRGVKPFPPPLSADAKAAYDKLSKLKGSEFDKAYVKNAVEDHTKDVAEYKKEAVRISDPKLKQYASSTLPVIEGHLKMARAMEAKMGSKKS